MLTEAVILAALTAYSKTIDLVVAIRADMPADKRAQEWAKHFERLEKWDAFVQGLFSGELFKGEEKP
jgi:hypothetical protein